MFGPWMTVLRRGGSFRRPTPILNAGNYTLLLQPVNDFLPAGARRFRVNVFLETTELGPWLTLS
jgi:hypothetical protein